MVIIVVMIIKEMKKKFKIYLHHDRNEFRYNLEI